MSKSHVFRVHLLFVMLLCMLSLMAQTVQVTLRVPPPYPIYLEFRAQAGHLYAVEVPFACGRQFIDLINQFRDT